MDEQMLRTLRAANPAEVSRLLRTYPDSLIHELLSSVEDETLSAWVISIFLKVNGTPLATCAALRSQSSHAQQAAIPCLAKLLCSDASCAAAWSALGGAGGLAALMDSMSVRMVRELCSALGKTADAPGGQRERRDQLAEVLRLLQHGAEPTKRNLAQSYCRLARACEPRAAASWGECTIDAAWAKSVTMAGYLRKSFWPCVWRGCWHLYSDEEKTQFLDKTARDDRYKTCLQALAGCDVHVGADAVRYFLGRELSEEEAGRASVTLLPLAKVCARADSQTHDAAWDLIIEFVARHEKCRGELVFSHNPTWESMRPRHGLLHYAARPWAGKGSSRLVSRDSDRHKFSFLIRQAMEHKSRDAATDIEIFLPVVPRPARYMYLRLYLQVQGVDIRSLEEINATKSDLRMPLRLFMLMPPRVRLPLFEGFVRNQQREFSRPHRQYHHSEEQHWSFSIETQGKARRVDTSVLHALLLHHEARQRGLSVARAHMQDDLRAEVERRKQRAKEGNEPSDRQEGVASTFRLCVAIGDLSLLDDTLVWARRFLRDRKPDEPYMAGSWFSPQLLDMLCATAPADRGNLAAADKILRTLFHTVILSQREPATPSWEAVFSLITTVLTTRIERLAKEADEDIYDTMFAPTLMTAVEIEKLTLRHNLVESVHGLVDYDLSLKPSDTVCRFLDELASARDEVWREHRLYKLSDVAALPSPWPQGLAIQSLLPSTGIPSGWKMPYIKARAAAIIFADPDAVLETPKEDKETIDCHIHDWKFALQLYCALYDELSPQQRKYKAWEHALGQLSRRLTPEEATVFWTPIFSCLDQQPTVNTTWKIRPMGNEPNIVEWNPNPCEDTQSSIKEPKERHLEPTILDCMLAASRTMYSGEHSSRMLSPGVVVRTGDKGFENFWGAVYEYEPQTQGEVDALIVLSLLIFNTHGADKSLLKTPFPSTEKPRIPAVYLEDSFLEKNGRWIFALRVLKRHVKSIPSTLLQQLASSLEQNIDRDEADGPPVAAVVRLLRYCDRPAASCRVSQAFILNHPDKSAWHRHILSQGLLNRLPYGQAQRFFGELFAALMRRLGQANIDSAKKEPAVKITTVKMLANVLHGNSFVTVNFTLNCLVGVLRQATHLDIIRPALEAMVSIFDNIADNEVQNRVLELTEQYAVPIAASLDEKKRMTEDDWRAAQTGPLPGIVTDTASRPIATMIDRRTDKRWKRVKNAMLRKSAQNHSRWMDLFMGRNDHIFREPLQLPRVPVTIRELSKQLKWKPIDPDADDIMEMLRQYTLSILEKADTLFTIAARIRTSDLGASEAGNHWLRIWGRGIEYSLLSETTGLLSILEQCPRSKPVREEVQRYYLDIADSLVRMVNLQGYLCFTKILSRDIKRIRELLPGLFREMAVRIDSMRTQDWVSNPSREPKVLPDTFALKLLNLPSLDDGAGENPEGQAAVFAERVLELQRGGLTRGISQYNLGLLRSKVVHECQRADTAAAVVCIRLGSLASLDNAACPGELDRLRLQIASDALIWMPKLQRDTADETRMRVRAMIDEWSSSPVEEFRELAHWTHLRFWARPEQSSAENRPDWLHGDGDGERVVPSDILWSEGSARHMHGRYGFEAAWRAWAMPDVEQLRGVEAEWAVAKSYEAWAVEHGVGAAT